MRVIGFLKYAGDDQNLYPDWRVERARADGRCLPVAVAKPELLGVARTLNGAWVVVEGRVERLLQRRRDRYEMNLAWCRDIGVRATRIERP